MNQAAHLNLRSKVTSKGQTTIPKEVRDALGVGEGALIEWVVEGQQVKVRAKTRNIADYAGFLGQPPNGRRVSIEEMDVGIANAVSERFARKVK